jgi:hypothetical protein
MENKKDKLDDLATCRGFSPVRTVKFRLGRIMITPGALAALEWSGEDAEVYIRRHAVLDPGDLSPQDQAANLEALKDGARILSAFRLADGNTRLWIITEADRSRTTLMLPEEY